MVASNSNLATNIHTHGLGHTGIGNSLKQPFLSMQPEMTVIEAQKSPSNLLLKNETKDAPTLLEGRKEKTGSSKEIASYNSNFAKE